MKREIGKENITRLLNLSPVVLVSSGYKDKKNITTCAWCMPVSKSPVGVSLALARSHFSSELIKKSGEFIINIPGWNLLDQVLRCGVLTGWKVDKFKEVGLTSQKACRLRSPRIGEALASIECVLFDIKEAGDHYLFLGEGVYAEVEEEVFDFQEGVWKTEKAELIFHLGKRFFMKSTKAITI